MMVTNLYVSDLHDQLHELYSKLSREDQKLLQVKIQKAGKYTFTDTRKNFYL